MNSTTSHARSLLISLLLAVGSGCLSEPDEQERCGGIACGPCPPALTLRVVFPQERLAPEVRMGPGQGGCTSSGHIALCNVSQQGAGRYELELHATGYRSHHHVEEVARVEPKGCCDCGYAPRTVDLVLEPE